jgi:hypothetical protein
VKGFEALPDELPKSFLFTGNALDEIVIPGLSSLGVGKSATAHLIKAAAGGVYSGKGYTLVYPSCLSPPYILEMEMRVKLKLN